MLYLLHIALLKLNKFDKRHICIGIVQCSEYLSVLFQGVHLYIVAIFCIYSCACSQYHCQCEVITDRLSCIYRISHIFPVENCVFVYSCFMSEKQCTNKTKKPSYHVIHSLFYPMCHKSTIQLYTCTQCYVSEDQKVQISKLC